MSDAEILPSELLYLTSDPHEVPLVLPPWARDVPELAELIDRGCELHQRGLAIQKRYRGETEG